MIRSAGSFGGLPGKFAEAIRMAGDIVAKRTLGRPSKVLNHASGARLSRRRPFAARVAISHAVIGDTWTPSASSWAADKAFRLWSDIGSPFISQSAAQLSRSKGRFMDR